SGRSNDTGTPVAARAAAPAGSTLAIDVFCYRLAPSLAGPAVALARLDGLNFTGAIGEDSPLLRAPTVLLLPPLGLALDPAATARGSSRPSIRPPFWSYRLTRSGRSPRNAWRCSISPPPGQRNRKPDSCIPFFSPRRALVWA